MKQVKDRNICKKGEAQIAAKLNKEEFPNDQGTIDRIKKDWFAMRD